MNQRSTQSHFRTDFNDPQEVQPVSAPSRNRSSRDRAQEDLGGDEDAQLQAAIEASKKTAQLEEKKRHQQKARV